MPKKKSLKTYFNLFIEKISYYKDEYILVCFSDKTNLITIKHKKCGKNFIKHKSTYKYHPECNNRECIKNKIKKTNLEKYGVENPAQNKKIKDKIIQTNLKKYGVKCSSQNSQIKEKTRITCLAKYGVSNSHQFRSVVEKTKKTNLNRYGVNAPIRNIYIKNKIKKTNLRKYGVEYNFLNKKVQEDIKKTNLKKYGFKNPAQNEKIKDKIKKAHFKKYFNKIKNYKMVEALFSIEEYFGTKKNKYKFRCKKCNFEFMHSIQDGRIPICKSCYPPLKGTSMVERDIQNWLGRSIKTENNKRFYINKA